MAAVASPAGRAALNARVPPPYLGFVATRGGICNNYTTANKQFNGRQRMVATEDLTAVKLLFASFYVEGSGFTEVALPGTNTLTAGIEYAGVFSLLKWGGSTTLSIPNAVSVIESDFTTVSIPKGASFFVRPCFRSSNGIPYVNGAASVNYMDYANGDYMQNAASGLSDTSIGGTITDSGHTNGVCYRLGGIVGMTTRSSCILLGDSRTFGRNDTMDSTGDAGDLARSIGAAPFGYVNLGIASDRPNKFLASHAGRVAFGQYASHLICEYGINDVYVDGLTGAQAYANLQQVHALYPYNTPLQTTITPAPTANAARVALNNLIRTGGMAYYELADVVETSRDSGTWTSGYSTDSLHANATGEAAILASGVIDTRRIARQ